MTSCEQWNAVDDFLEFGTLGGYSTQWFAAAVGPQGKVTTLEYEPRHAEPCSSPGPAP